jgi:hypothetical protein
VLDEPLLATTATGTVVVPPSAWVRPAGPARLRSTRHADVPHFL